MVQELQSLKAFDLTLYVKFGANFQGNSFYQ